MILITLKFSGIFDRKKRTVHYGLETISYRSPQLWSLLPGNIKEVEAKNRIGGDCPSRLCKPYFQNIGFF